jgi:nitroreductase
MIKKTSLLVPLLLIVSQAAAAEKKQAKTTRTAQYPVDDIFLNRWSPRAMSGEAISDAELMSLFEAARWAPSSYNGQPWRFIYAKRNTPAWDKLFNLMVPFNQSWTKNASALVVVVSRTTFEWNNQPAVTHSFDTGAACQNLALQASAKGLVVHGMSGFDYDRARKDLHIPDTFTVDAMFAIGKPAPAESLPEDLRKMETPSPRKPVAELAFEGTFKN